MSYPSNLDGFFGKQRRSVDFRKRIEQDIEDLDDDDEGETRGCGSSSRSVKPDDHNDEEWEIRSSIELDCALDNEVSFFEFCTELNCLAKKKIKMSTASKIFFKLDHIVGVGNDGY